MINPADLVRLGALPGGYRIFLRPWYDRLNPVMRLVAGLHRRINLKTTRLVAVVGSLGKTTTRRALFAALDCPRRNYSYSNYGSSLSENLLRIRGRDARGVLEVGVAGPGPTWWW
jgi:UDP-N-acetylmuramyl pentapeptide synthase